jgi:tetratricopeptide (TPR) repeat protein
MLRNLLSKKPDFYEATELLGDLLCEKQNYKEVLNIYMEALKYHPNKYEIYYNLGIVYTMLNDFNMAKQYYEKSAQINHELYNAYYNIAQISLLYKDLEGAEEYFTKSLYGEETEAKSYFQLAKIYLIKNQREKAINFINKAIELNSEYTKIIEDEPMFLAIKQYILVPTESTLQKKSISVKEEKVEEHLENTFEITENINKVQIPEDNEKSIHKEERDE